MSQTILCFGDFNTWGFIPGSEGERYAPDVRWPGILKTSLGEALSLLKKLRMDG
ncbi:hypothetical protein N8813_05200 [bacterium]|jgi:hypothetical protein|nr:hypothetical protein [bacterium]